MPADSDPSEQVPAAQDPPGQPSRAQTASNRPHDRSVNPQGTSHPNPDAHPSDERAIDDAIEALLFACLESADPTHAIEAAAIAHPELAEPLRKAYGEMVRFNLVGQTTSGSRAFADIAADSMPERLGEYRLRERLGAGGMGVVFLARDDVLQRTVALKLIRPEHLYMPGARERFQREVETIARLQHPGIVPIYGVGKAEGMPYFTMQHVNGCSLSFAIGRLHTNGAPPDARLLLELAANRTKSDQQASSESGSGSTYGIEGLNWPDTCVALAIQVAGALHHAHERGVLHRDVKPSNILLTREGRAILVDFGLAWSADTDQRLTHSTSQLGSLPYLPPEHIAGNAPDPSRAADVYSLGVTLYEMLTLRNPFLAKNAEATRRNILGARTLRLRREQRGISWELETVCMKAMDPDPAKRYRTMLEFLRDLERVRNRESIEARRPSFMRRTRRWSQRHPTIMAALTVAMLGSVAALFSFGMHQQQARRQSDSLREAAEVERYSALLASADVELHASQRPARARWQLSQCREQDRGWEWSHLEYASDQSTSIAEDFGGGVQDLIWSPDGESYLVATQDKVLSCRTTEHHERWRIDGIATSAIAYRPVPDGHELICGRRNAELWVHDLQTGEPIASFEQPDGALVGELTSIVASPDGRRIYSVCANGDVSLWNAETRTFVKSFGKHTALAHCLAINADGSRLATGGFDRMVRVFDTESLEQIATYKLTHWCFDMSFATDGHQLILADGTTLQAVDTADPDAKVSVLDRAHRTVMAVRSSPDGKLIAATVQRRILHVYRIKSQSPLRVKRIARLIGHEGLLQHIHFSADSRSILTGCSDQTVRIWSPTQGAEIGYRPHQRIVTAVAFVGSNTVVSADSRGNLRTSSGDGNFRTLEAEPGQSAHDASVVAIIPGPPASAKFMSVDETGRTITWQHVGSDWQAQQTTETGHTTAAVAVHTTWPKGSPPTDRTPADQTLVASAQPTQTLIVATTDGEIVTMAPDARRWAAHDERITAIACYGDTLWTADVAGQLRCWNIPTGELLLEGPMHPEWIAALVIAPDGSWLATSCADTVIRIVDTKTGEVLRRLVGHGRVPLTMVTDSTGSRLISGGGFDAELRFWQPNTGRCLLSMSRTDPVLALAFNRTTKTLALGGRIGHVRLLRTRPDGPRVFGDRTMPVDTITSPPGGHRPR